MLILICGNGFAEKIAEQTAEKNVEHNTKQASCMNSSRSHEEINVCQHLRAKNLEYKLIALEKKLMLKFDEPQKSRFREAQTTWRKMVSLDCTIESDFFEGAPIYPAIVSQCLFNHYW